MSEPQTPSQSSLASTGAATKTVSRGRDASGELRTFLRGLVAMQRRLLGGDAGAVFLTGKSPGESRLFAYSVDDAHPKHDALTEALSKGPESVRLARLAADVAAAPLNAADSTGRCESIQIGSDSSLYTGQSTHRAFATPLVAAGESRGACVVLVPNSASVVEAEGLRTLALTVARFEAYIWRQQYINETEQKTMLRETLQLLDTAQQGVSSEDMASLVCHELQRRFGCSRVSIGIIDRDRIKAIAVSGSDHLDRRTGVIEALEAAMEECASQDTEVIYPAPELHERDPSERRIARDHEKLSDGFGPSGILSLPLRLEGDLVGVAVLEREPHDPFPAAVVPLVRLVAEFIGPAVWLRRLADRGIIAVSRDRALDLGEAIVGPRHTVGKLIGGAIAAVLVLSLILPIPARVACDVELAPAFQRTLVPAYAGRLEAVYVKAGAKVEEGQAIAKLSTAELELQLAEAVSNRDTILAQLDGARTAGELADVRVGEATLEESAARIALIEDRIRAATIRAPITGLVGRGELEPLVGSQVDSTRALLEIISEDVIARVLVPEGQIHRVDEGDEGWLSVRSVPGRRVEFVADSITPAAEAVQGANVYVVKGRLAEPDARPGWLRAGMTGSARIKDGWTTPAIAVLSPVIDSLRLRLWW